MHTCASIQTSSTCSVFTEHVLNSWPGCRHSQLHILHFCIQLSHAQSLCCDSTASTTTSIIRETTNQCVRPSPGGSESRSTPCNGAHHVAVPHFWLWNAGRRSTQLRQRGLRRFRGPGRAALTRNRGAQMQSSNDMGFRQTSRGSEYCVLCRERRAQDSSVRKARSVSNTAARKRQLDSMSLT